jgi:hypothetical protein
MHAHVSVFFLYKKNDKKPCTSLKKTFAVFRDDDDPNNHERTTLQFEYRTYVHAGQKENAMMKASQSLDVVRLMALTETKFDRMPFFLVACADSRRKSKFV